MSQTYNRINWINGQAGNTPMSADNLNIMDAAIETLSTLAEGEIAVYVDTVHGNDATGEMNNPLKPFASMHYVFTRLPGYVTAAIYIRGNVQIIHPHYVESSSVSFYPWNSTADTQATIATFGIEIAVGASIETRGNTRLSFYINLTMNSVNNLLVQTNGEVNFEAHTPSNHDGAAGNGVTATSQIQGVDSCMQLFGAGTLLNFGNTNLVGVQHQYKLADNAVTAIGCYGTGANPTLINSVLVAPDTLTTMFRGMKTKDIGSGIELITNAVSSLALNPALTTI